MSLITPNDFRAEDFGDLLKAYFRNEGKDRFKFERPISEGAQGYTWRLRYRLTASSSWKKIVLKHERAPVRYDKDFVETDEDVARDAETMDRIRRGGRETELETEKRLLTSLQWAKHICQIFAVPYDPLASLLPLRPHRMDDWLYLEWIENGTVRDFIGRVIDAGLATLPNRVLWRFFLCLLRMTIAMAWPPAQPAYMRQRLEHVGDRPPGNMTHNDMHTLNIMVGAEDPSSGEYEHDIIPQLKLIDFGYATEEPPRSDHDPVKDNIFQVGGVMAELITLQSQEVIDLPTEEAVSFTLQGGGETFRTMAMSILPDDQGQDPVPCLDSSLRTAIASCLAVQHELRPTVNTLTHIAKEAIKLRDAEWYARPESGHPNPAMERDAYIDNIFQVSLRNAPVSTT
ncbi:hypothetical protein BKA67DRAFT_694461 [Truncatella angustata]|uniref:Protein kinase domain-containing protein n=1 Tax=Truncatella angustata TaxID=152316 RepID=A0A9P8RJV5_9PEZI|nr:uncharacterized protein BKA67DRAFT_694461 [Truncatella angustata]KAH6647395.1 hypothetical protein BKA67DRAFT_694461 [Truncatella angustata]